MNHPKTILFSIGARARKSLSQSFLKSPFWSERLVAALSDCEAEEYWEIGPGLGALTSLLGLKTTKPIKLFEYDRKITEFLRRKFPRFEIIEGDFLEWDFPGTYPKKGNIAVISNLPYHLSSPIFFKLLSHRHWFKRLVLTFQKEFGDRLLGTPRTKSYGALSVLAQLHFKIDTLGILPPGAFYPQPEVSSQALILTPLPSTPLFGVEKVVKAAFSHRRKKALSNLKEYFPDAPMAEVFDRLSLSSVSRAEELTKEKFVELAKAISSP